MTKDRISTFPWCLFLFILFGSNYLNANEFSDIQPLAKHSLLLDIDTQQGLTVAVGERGHILYSTNYKDWVQASVPTHQLLTAVYLQDSQTGWAVGHHGLILKTTDGAKNWRQVAYTQDEAPLLDIIFINSTTGFAVGAYGAFYITHDAGETWNKKYFNDSLDFDFHLNAIAAIDKNRLYIVGESGHIFRSDNAGESWQLLSSPYDGSFFGVLPVSYDELYVFGLRGNLYKSHDAGLVWEKVNTETNALLSGAIQLKEKSIIVTSLADKFFVKHSKRNDFIDLTSPGRDAITSLVNIGELLILVGKTGIHYLQIKNFESSE